jgi:hypothetical protein
MDKLQRAGRDFLLHLVAAYGPVEAARILRGLDEIEELTRISVLSHESERLPPI